MEKVNGKWISQQHFDTEEDRKIGVEGTGKPFDQMINSVIGLSCLGTKNQ